MIRWIDDAWCVNFGKHKGKKLYDLFMKEQKVLKWIINGSFDTEVRQICRDLLDKGILPPAPK
jgi:hypothetical protein